jgi:hypothetical protein
MSFETKLNKEALLVKQEEPKAEVEVKKTPVKKTKAVKKKETTA